MTLRRRLKSYYQRQRLLTQSSSSNIVTQSNATERYYDYLLIVDFECTCEDNVYKYEHEIIEFPVVVVDTKRRIIVKRFIVIDGIV